MSTPAHAIILEHGRFTSDGSTSILETALAQGVAVPFSCQRGECGSCRAQVAGGA
ncbi:2Fe-2S iron-sulfur cluster-binding protein, partial [Achromobacter xylosoxidans]